MLEEIDLSPVNPVLHPEEMEENLRFLAGHALDLDAGLEAAGLPVTTLENLSDRATSITGVPAPIEFDEPVVGRIRYRDTSVVDLVRQVAAG